MPFDSYHKIHTINVLNKHSTMYTHYYFLGIGGIGMSALARYFKAKGFAVAGYDRTRSRLTQELEAEGIDINYDDTDSIIPGEYRNPNTTMVVYTPAIPADNRQFIFFKNNNFEIAKRAAVLGQITRIERGLCVAGTHGKTTTSTMLAHILHQSHIDCNAFLGGVAKNYSSNLILSDRSDLVVIEADEFDRSFHHLAPYMAIVTATDADHLDIYGTHEAYIESFAHFTELIVDGGTLIMKKGIELQPRTKKNVTVYTYSSTEKADFYADNILFANGSLFFDFVTPDCRIDQIELGVPVLINVENAVAALAVAHLNGVTSDEMRSGMLTFKGIRRRFDFQLRTPAMTIIDDYAHHPREIEASIRSVNTLYPDRKKVFVFQPHLYTRTRDFYREFAAALSHADQVILVELYPARETPIPGVSSKMILDEVTSPVKRLTTKEQLIDTLRTIDFSVLVTVGAGDLDTYLPRLVEAFEKQ